jgi:hypothetical protein
MNRGLDERSHKHDILNRKLDHVPESKALELFFDYPQSFTILQPYHF